MVTGHTMQLDETFDTGGFGSSLANKIENDILYTHQ